MLFKATNLSPDSIAIDPSHTNTFTFTNNGDALTHYQFIFYKNSDSSVLFDSAKLASTVASYTLPANSLPVYTDIKYRITVWSGSNSVQSDFVFLKTLNTPIVSMSIPTIIGVRSYTFTASYNQVQMIPYQRYKFILYDGSDSVLVDSGWIYGYNLSYFVEGLTVGSYKAEMIVESTTYQLSGTTGTIPFTVSYTQPDPASNITATPNDDTGGITVSWAKLIQVSGDSTGTIGYTTGKFGQGVQVSDNSTVIYDETVPLGFYLNCWIKVAPSFVGDFLSLGNDEVKVGYNGERYYLNVNGNTVYSIPYSLPVDFFKLGMKSNRVIIEANEYTLYLL